MASLVYTVLGIIGAFYFQELIDTVLPDALSKTLMTLSIGVIVLNIFKVILNAFRSHLLLYLSQKLDIALLLGYYKHVLELPMNFFGTRKVGEIVSRFNDAGKVRDAISGATLTIMIDTFMAIAGEVVLYIQNPKLFAITIIMVILYFVFVIVVSFNGWYEKLNRKQMEDNAQLTSYMVESLNGVASKSTIHKDCTDCLEQINPTLAQSVRKVLDVNKQERHIRSGLATREKYLHQHRHAG